MQKFSPFIVALDALSGRGIFETDEVDVRFGYGGVTDKVSLRSGDKTELYTVGYFTFYHNAGLYIIVGCKNHGDIEYIGKLMHWLSYSGIGGKVSSGYGKFEVLEWVDLQETPNHVYALLKGYLERQDANRFISLTTSLPAEDEIGNVIGYYGYLGRIFR